MGISAPAGVLVDTQNPFSPSSQNPAIVISDKPTGGTIGTSVGTVNISSFGVITQTTAGQTLTLPIPSNTVAARFFALKSDAASTTSFSFYGLTIAPGQMAIACYAGGSWATGSVALLGSDDVQCSKLSIDNPRTISVTGSVDDLSVSGASSIRFNPTAALTLTGIVAPASNQLLFATNISTFAVTLNDDDAASLAVNRIRTGTGSPIAIEPNAALLLQYDLTSTLWRVIGGAGGASSKKIQTVATSGATTITDWNSTVLIPTLTANITLNYPTAVGNIGKELDVINVGTPNSFTIAHTPVAGQTINWLNWGSEVDKPNSGFTLQAVSATNIRQTQSLWNADALLATKLEFFSNSVTVGALSNDLVLPEWSVISVNSSAGDAVITGFAAPDYNRLLFLTNNTPGLLTLENNDGRSLIANRIRTGVIGPIKIEQNNAVILLHNQAVGCWTVFNAEPGLSIDRIKPIFSGAGVQSVGWGETALITGSQTADITVNIEPTQKHVGKSITFIRMGPSNNFLLNLVPDPSDTLTLTANAAELKQLNGAITLRALDSSKINQVSSTGVSSARKIQQLNATGTVTEWNSVVEIGATPLTANAVITLPACTGHEGKDVIIKRLDNTAFTVTVAAAATNTIELTTPSILNTQFGAITLTAVSATKSEQTSSIGGSAVDSIQTVNSATSTNVTAWNSYVETTFTAAGQTLTIPTIATADIGKKVGVRNAGTNAFTLALQTGTLTSAIGLSITAGMSVWVEAISTTLAVVTATNAAPPQITTAKSDFIKNDTAGLGTPFTVATAVAGYTGERVNWDAPLSNGLGLTITAGVWQHPTNKRVSLRSSIHPTFTTGGSDVFSLVEITAGVATVLQSQKAGQAVTSSNNPLPAGNLDWEFDPDPSKHYAIQFTGGYGSNTYNSSNRLNWLQIVETGVVSTTATLPTVAAMQGQKIWADQATDMGDWILLNGRAKSTLTVAQQAIATALGYGVNIPDMRDRVPMGASGTRALNTTGGSFTISQNNLPNVNLGPSAMNAIYNGGNQDNNASASGSTGFPAWENGSPISGWPSAAGRYFDAHLNGNVPQQPFTPAYGTGNWFVWLGPTAPTVTHASASLQQLNATGNVLAWNSIVEIGDTALTANMIATLPPCSANDIGKTIKFSRRDAAAFTATLAAAGGNTLDVASTTALNTQWGAIEIVCVSAIKAEQISPIVTTNTIGDAKSGFQSADHNGWLLLDGRLKTALTATQQANATALGIGANLPDATGRGFVQGALLTQVGSSTIARSDLPQVNITTNTGGNHTHSTYSPDGSTSAGVANGTRLTGEISRLGVFENTTGTGAHTHTIALNGNVPQTAYMPASIGVNQFIFLGA